MANYEEIKRMINNLFNDMSKPKGETLGALRALQEEIDDLIICLEADIENEKESK